MRVAAFITSHGFGHAGRASAVLDALHARRPDLAVDLYTEVPDAFLRSSLRAPYRRIASASDVGMVQHGPFEADLEATAAAVTAFLSGLDDAAGAAAARLAADGCRAVLCDISPLGIVAAARAGLPSVLIENFRWDWIYAGVERAPAALLESGRRLAEIYRRADLHVQVAPACDRIQRAVQVELPVARGARGTRAAVRATLGIAADETVVVVTTGGVPGAQPWLAELRRRPDITFVVTGADRSGRAGNLLRIQADAPLYLPDLLLAGDAVVAKLGYSTVTESWRAGLPLLRIPRRQWPEGEVLSAWAAAHVAGMELDEPAFQGGAWVDRVDELLALPRAAARERAGQEDVADAILTLWG